MYCLYSAFMYVHLANGILYVLYQNKDLSTMPVTILYSSIFENFGIFSSDSTEAESDATSMLHWLYARSVRLHYSCHPTTPHHTTHTLPIYRLGRPGRHTTAIGELDKTHNITCEKLLFGRFCITYPRIGRLLYIILDRSEIMIKSGL